MVDKGGIWIRIKYKISSVESVEQKTTIGHNFMNEDGI